ncbi:MAG: glucuronosyltransferase [Sphingomonadaceae bacterium]|nr:glucuronosyltransferase [Sphingomonadaceae bacterium]
MNGAADPAGGPPPQVFASVGSMFAFDRFVRAVDDWAAAHPDVPVLVQIGSGEYVPRAAAFVRMMPPGLYQQRIREARLFVAHAGMGSIIAAIQAGKPLLMMPRRLDLGEHTTDHQFATLAKFGGREGLHSAMDEAALHAAIDALLADTGAPPAPIAPFAGPELIGRVRAFIHGSDQG